MERFRLGRVVARSFSIWGRELLVLLGLVAMIQVPRVACVEAIDRIWSFPSIDVDEPFRSWVARLMAYLSVRFVLDRVFHDLATALVIFAAYARLRGGRAAPGQSVRGALGRWLPVLRVSLCLSLLGTLLSYGPWLLLLGIGGPEWIWYPFLLAVMVLTALLLSPFWVAVPAAVVEEPRRLLRRSWRLTRGHRLAIGAIVVLLLAIEWGAGRLVWLLLYPDTHWLIAKAIWWSQDLVMVSLAAVFAAVGYHALRLEKEGVDVSDLESVFA